MRTAYIGMGANLASWAGTPEDTLAAAALRLESLGRVAGRSSLYSTEPVGFLEQPQFVNAVVAIETELGPRELLKGLLDLEREFGRERAAGFQNGPRTLDLDILLLEDLTISEPGLEIPHPRLGERAFALIPLAEIAPEIPIAPDGETAAQQVERLQREEGETSAVVRMASKVWPARPVA